MDSQLDPPSPQGGAAVKRPPPGIAPPSGPAPPWVRTLAPEEARDSEGDDEIYEEDFEEEEVIATNVRLLALSRNQHIISRIKAPPSAGARP